MYVLYLIIDCCFVFISQEEVKQAIESLCSYLPSEFTDTCKTFVEQYGDKVVELLLKKLDAHAICTELGLCKTGTVSNVGAYLKALDGNSIPILKPVDNLPIQPIVQGTVLHTARFIHYSETLEY